MHYLYYKKRFPVASRKFIKWLSELTCDEINASAKHNRDLRFQFINNHDFNAGIIDYKNEQTICSYQIENPDISRFLDKFDVNDYGSFDMNEDSFYQKCFKILDCYWSDDKK